MTHTYIFPQIGRVVFSRKTKVLVMPHESDDSTTFTGEDIRTGEISCMWDKSKFFAYPLYEKEFYTVGAVHRMIDRGKIDKETAVRLLVERTNIKPASSARGTVETWVGNPRKRFTQ